MHAGAVWDNLNLMDVTGRAVIADNKGGSLLTMYSQGGLIFGVINIVGNFGKMIVTEAAPLCISCRSLKFHRFSLALL